MDAIGEMRISSHIPLDWQARGSVTYNRQEKPNSFQMGAQCSVVRAPQAGLHLQVMLASVNTLLSLRQSTANIWQPLAPGQIHLHWWLRRAELMFLTKPNRTEKKKTPKQPTPSDSEALCWILSKNLQNKEASIKEEPIQRTAFWPHLYSFLQLCTTSSIWLPKVTWPHPDPLISVYLTQ